MRITLLKAPLTDQKRFKQQSGFTLIELVIVIVLISIVALSLSNLTSETVYGYIDAKDRNRLSQSTKWTTERIAREVREALPQSIRASNSGGIHCVEFMNIVNASTYLDIPPSGDVSSFNAVDFDLSFSAGLTVAIMPINPTTIYGGSGTLGSVAAIANSGNEVTITLSGPTNFSRRSPQNRFYLLNSPISFCLNDISGDVTRYAGYTTTAAQPLPPTGGTSELLAENFSANGNVFTYQSGTLNRSGLLQMNFRAQNRDRNLVGTAESFEVFHEVHIRNVP